MKDHVDRCDGCGEIAFDIDVGFCPSRNEMRHSCGGTWRKVPARSDLVVRVRAEIIAGQYVTDAKLTATATRLARELDVESDAG